MATYFTLLTKIGQAKIANAQALGQVVKWTAMALGDGNGNPTTPIETKTGLVHEVYRANINQLTVDAENPNYLIAELIVPTSVGGWFVHEVGIFDADGDMVAIANFPATYKPAIAEGSGRDLVVRVIIQVSNTSVVTLKVDPAVILASQKWVVENFNLARLLPGGRKGQIPVKASDTDGDIIWDSVGGMPIGFEFDWPGITPPPGALEENGVLLSRTTCPQLWEFAKNSGNIVLEAAWTGGEFTYGTGGVSGTDFRIPDRRGEFTRGWDNGRGVDVGRKFGSAQKGSLLPIDTSAAGTPDGISGLSVLNSPTLLAAQIAVGVDAFTVADYPGLYVGGSSPAASAPLPGTGGNGVASGVARSRNVARLACIKAFDAAVNPGLIDITELSNDVADLSASITEFPLKKSWVSGLYQPVAATQTIITHNLRLRAEQLQRTTCDLMLECVVDQAPYVVGDVIRNVVGTAGTISTSPVVQMSPLTKITENSVVLTTGAYTPYLTGLQTNGNYLILSLSNWRYRVAIFY